MIKGRIQYTIKNLNREKILKEIVTITNVKNIKYSQENISFNINKNDSKNVEKILNKKSATILNKRDLGLFNFLKNTIFRYGILLSIILFIIFLFICNNFIFNYNIYGIENIQKQEIINVLQDCNITKFTPKNKVDIKKLTNKLQKIDNVSLVSVIIRGNTLVINIKEKVYNSEYEDKENFLPIVSNVNGIITELTVVQGTPLVKVGDLIKYGQELISPKITDTNGQTLMVKPMADIKVDVFYSSTTTISESQILYKDTGKVIEQREILINNIPIFKTDNKIEFEVFRTEIVSENIGCGFLPIKYVKTKYIEQETIIEENYYTKNQNQILEQCKQKTRQLFESYAIIKDEYNKITKEAGIVRITYTFVVNQTLQ